MKKFFSKKGFSKQGEHAKSAQERQSIVTRSCSDDDELEVNVNANGVKLIPAQNDDSIDNLTNKSTTFRRRMRKQRPASNSFAKARQELSAAIDADDVEMFENILDKNEKFGLTLESRELIDYHNSKTLFHEALEKDKRVIANYIAEKCSISYLLDDYPDVIRRESRRKLRSTFANRRKTCLHLMVEKGNKKVLELVMSRLKKACTIVDDNLNTSWPKLPSFGFCKTQKDLEVFLRASVTFDTKDRRRRTGTAIHLAVVSGQWQTLEILTSHGLSVNDRDSEQETPLMLAVLQNQTESFIELVKLQADVNMQNKQDCSALHLAISEGRDHMVKVLIDEESTDLNVERIKNPRWPIEMAAKSNNARVVGWLLDRKKGKGAVFRANVHQALLIAASNGFADVISVILERKPKLLNKPDDFGNTPVMLATDSGKLEAVKLLVEMPDIDLDKRNNLGQSVFDLAMKLEDESVLCFLLGRVRFNEALDSFYVHTAVANGKVDRLKLLLADDHPHERLHLLEETTENSVYHTAAAFNSSEVIDLFLDETDDIKDFQNKNYETALHVAVRRNHVESVKSLLNKRVRVDILDGEGQNVLHAAITTRATGIEIVEMLIEAFEKVDPTLINEQESNGNTALHLSAMFNKPEVIRKLGVCDPEIENKDGETALHVAARAGSVESVRTLLELFYVDRRANIDRRDELGFTALYRSAENGDRDKYELMLLFGADMGLTSESGPSILHRLVECCRADPNKAEKYASVYRSTVEWSVVWYCRKKGLRCPLANTNQFYLVQLDAVRLLTSDTLYDGCNVMQYAAKKGESNLLKVILETPNVYKFNRNSPLRLEKIQEHHICSVRGSSLSIMSDLKSESNKIVQMEQNEGELAKFLDDKSSLPSSAVLYDATFLIPGHIPDLANNVDRSDSLNDGSQQRRRRSSAPPRSNVSCLEYLVENGQESDISEILSAEPFHSLVYNYWTMCRRGYELLMWKHVAYMVLLTYFVMPDNTWIQSRFQNGSVISENGTFNGTTAPITQNLFSVKIFSFFLIWPALIFIYELVTAMHFIVQMRYKKNGRSLRYELLGRLKVGEITSGLMRIPVGLMLFIFDNLSHISATAFAASCVAWYVNCVYSSSLQTYLECLAVFLVFGWLHTINYVKGFKDWNALASILKQILIKDITRFIYIYIFVLISFGYAIHVLMQINSHVRPELSSSSSTIYLTFYQMLSPGNVLDVTENPIYWHDDKNTAVSGSRVLRAVYATYSILSSVVLMNMLIAMMNSTYSDVKSVRSTAWRFESLRMALWIERNFRFVRKLRLIRFKAKFDKFQNRWFLKRNHMGSNMDHKLNSGVDALLGKLENDVPDKDRDMQTRRKSEDFTKKLEEMRTEIDRLNESLCEYENKSARVFNGLNMELKHIHELCLESYHLSRIACRRDHV